MKKIFLTVAICAISYLNIQAQSYADIKGFGIAILDTNGTVLKQVITGTYPQSSFYRFDKMNDSIFRAYLFVYRDSTENNDYVVFQGHKFKVYSAVGNNYVLLMNHNFDILYSSDTVPTSSNSGNTVTDSITNINYSIMSFNGKLPPQIANYTADGYDILFYKQGYNKIMFTEQFGSVGNDYAGDFKFISKDRLVMGWIMHDLKRGLSTDENITVRNRSFTISPNPVTNELRLDFGDAIQQIVNIKIYDASGRQLYKGTNSKNIDIADYKVGVYLVQVNYKDGNMGTQKFVKTNP